MKMVMNLKEQIDKNYKLNINKLLEYGFIKDKNEYHYLVNILNDDFSMEVIISNDNIKTKLVDLNTNLEYTNHKLKDKGEYASLVYNSYIEVLNDIKNKCYDKDYFIYPQSNEITKYIIDKYNSSPEYPWNDNNGIFRCPNGKWFAVILNVNKNKLCDESKDIEVLNIKCDNVNDLIKTDGIYKAYHMNKSKWISICLDNTLNTKEIVKLIDISYKIVNKK